MKFSMTLRRIAAVALLPLAVAACSDDDDNLMMTPQAGASFVRVAHLSPDAPNVDVWVDGARVLTDVPFRGVSDYLELDAGTYNVQVTPTGASTPVVIDADVTLAEDTAYTVAATGLLAAIAPAVLVDDRATDGSSAKVRFVHGAPDAPPVDITLTDGTVLFGAVAFGSGSATIPVGAGEYDLQVRAAGSETVVLSFGDVPLAAGTNYSVFAIGQLGDGSLDAIVAVDSGSGGTTVDLTPATADVRVAHLSPDAPNVDVWVNGAVVTALVDVPFAAVSGYLPLGAATADVAVYVTGTTSNPVIEASVTLLPGEAYTIAATGLVGQGDLAPIVLVDDRMPPAAGSTHVRFVHTSPDAPPVDVAVSGGSAIFTNTSFRGFAGYSSVAAGTYDLDVLLNSDKSVVLPVPGVQLAGATNVTIFAIGLAGDASLAALPVVDTP